MAQKLLVIFLGPHDGPTKYTIFFDHLWGPILGTPDVEPQPINVTTFEKQPWRHEKSLDELQTFFFVWGHFVWSPSLNMMFRACYREEESYIYPVNCAWKLNLHRKHGDSNREDKHLSYKLGHQLTNFQRVHAITNIHVQRLPIGRIGNPWSMDYPKDQPRIVWSTGLPWNSIYIGSNPHPGWNRGK